MKPNLATTQPESKVFRGCGALNNDDAERKIAVVGLEETRGGEINGVAGGHN